MTHAITCICYSTRLIPLLADVCSAGTRTWFRQPQAAPTNITAWDPCVVFLLSSFRRHWRYRSFALVQYYLQNLLRNVWQSSNWSRHELRTVWEQTGQNPHICPPAAHTLRTWGRNLKCCFQCLHTSLDIPRSYCRPIVTYSFLPQ